MKGLQLEEEKKRKKRNFHRYIFCYHWNSFIMFDK